MEKVVTGAFKTKTTGAFNLIVTVVLLNKSIKGLSVALYMLATWYPLQVTDLQLELSTTCMLKFA